MTNKIKALIKLNKESLNFKEANNKLNISDIKLNGDDFINSMQRIKDGLKE